MRRGFDLKRLAPFVLGGLAGIPLGVALLPRLDIDWFKAILGALLALWCPAMLLPALLGARIYIGISEARFRQVVLGLLTLSSVALLANSVPRLLARIG